MADEISLGVERVYEPHLSFRGIEGEDLISITILLIFLTIGITLLIKSRNIKSKSLKTSIILPLLFWILGIIYWVGHLFNYNGVLLDFGAFIYISLILFPVGLFSTSLSHLALRKVKEKTIARINLIMNIFYTILPIILLFIGLH